MCALRFRSTPASEYGTSEWAIGVDGEEEEVPAAEVTDSEKEDSSVVATTTSSSSSVLPTPTSTEKTNPFDTDGSSEEWSVLQKAFLFIIIIAGICAWIKMSKPKAEDIGYEKTQV